VKEAQGIARQIGVEHLLLSIEPKNEVLENPKDRCYLCKKQIFTRILDAARDWGAEQVWDGTNASDSVADRPGMRALQELGVRSPLRERGITKEQVRHLSKEAGLPTWDKPAAACLATRIPHGERITEERLRRVAAGEAILRHLGFRQVRLRDHGNIARIEVAKEERHKFFNESFLDEISPRIKALGFEFVAFELGGYA
jgi:uncharacterized protein